MTTTERIPLLGKPNGCQDMSRVDFWLVMAGVWTLSFIGSVDGTIVATLLSVIASSFEAMHLSSWIGASYLLSVCCFTPLYGRLCNIIGRRGSAMLAASLFGFGTTCCGFAQSMNQLIFFRALAGMGGGGMAVVGSVIVSDIVPLKSRGLYQGFANLLFGLGGAVGAPLGGWLGDTIGWRAAFYIQGPVLTMGLCLLWLHVREPESFTSAPADSIKEKIRRVDFAGPLMLVTSLGSLLLATSFHTSGGYAWSNLHVYGFFILCFMTAILFLVVELRWAAEPVMPASMVTQRTTAFVAINNFLIAVLSFSVLYNVPLFFTASQLRSSGNAGAHLISNSVSVAVGSLFAGWYMRHTGKYWWLQATSALGIVGATVILFFWSTETPEWVLYITLMPVGFGFATVLTTTLLALFASVPREQIPIATGISYLFRTTGQVLGVALSSTLTQSLLASNLRERIQGEGADDIIQKILDSAVSIHYLPPDLQRKATVSWALALRTVFAVQIGLAVLLFLSILPIQEHTLPDTVTALSKNNTIDEEAHQEL